MEYEYHLDIREMIKKNKKPSKCTSCNGTGYGVGYGDSNGEPKPLVDCYKCGGTGKLNA